MTQEQIAALTKAAENRKATQDAIRAEAERLKAERDANAKLKGQQG